MILMKLARALNGDPNDTDNWHDIQGYAKLVEDRILGRGVYAPASPAPSVGDVPASFVGNHGNISADGRTRFDAFAPAGERWISREAFNARYPGGSAGG
jgi:hypothetical protein